MCLLNIHFWWVEYSEHTHTHSEQCNHGEKSLNSNHRRVWAHGEQHIPFPSLPPSFPLRWDNETLSIKDLNGSGLALQRWLNLFLIVTAVCIALFLRVSEALWRIQIEKFLKSVCLCFVCFLSIVLCKFVKGCAIKDEPFVIIYSNLWLFVCCGTQKQMFCCFFLRNQSRPWSGEENRGIIKIFKVSPKLHLFDQKYRENT